jgi:TfoX/Sxy family transcriptional regulator of competence genes
MAYDEKLADRIRESLSGTKGILEKKMFGGIAFMWKDKMFVGIIKDDLMVRVLLDREEEALDKPHARPMDFTNKPMRGFIYVSPDGIKTKKNLDMWIELGKEYVVNSPPKKEKEKKKKKKKKQNLRKK